MEYGRQQSKVKTLLLQRCALRKFRVTYGQKTRDQITNDGGSKHSLVQTDVIKERSVHSIQSYCNSVKSQAPGISPPAGLRDPAGEGEFSDEGSNI